MLTSSDDDADIRKARENLLARKKEQKRLSKQAKLEQIARETEEVERKLRRLSLRKESTKRKKDTTIASLRKSDDVMEEVNELLDRKLNSRAGLYSSSSEASSISDSDSRSVRRNSRKDRRESGRRQSGKNKKLTSYVKYPQMWPHSFLSQNFVSVDKKYEDLTLAEFCAGYMTILENEKKSIVIHRTAHLKDLMYLATQYRWKGVLNFHAACLLAIERGEKQWGDDFQKLENATLAGAFLYSGRGSDYRKPVPSSVSGGSNEGMLFCRGYQKGICNQPKDHQGNFYGESKLLRHMCAKCWLKSRTIAAHPENDESCPSREQ